MPVSIIALALNPEAIVLIVIALAIATPVTWVFSVISNAITTRKDAKVRAEYLAVHQCKGITQKGSQCQAIVIDRNETTCKKHR